MNTIVTDHKEVCQVQNGDLSNQVAPRIIIVFDGAVGWIPEDKKKDFARLVSKNRWHDAFESCLRVNETMFRKILDLAWRKNVNIHMVTWMGDEAATEIENLMEMVPVRGCFSSTPEILARMLPYNPDVVAIYDPDPGHVFTYGSTGVLLEKPEQLGSML